MSDTNSTVHSYCSGFALVQNAVNDWSLRMVSEDGNTSVKVIRRSGPTAQAELGEMLNLLNASLRLQGCDV